MRSQDFMREAMALADKAAEMGEVPVGAVVVKNGEIIGRGYNTRETENSILGHAEINAINEASKALGDWRLDGCDLYVTLEPCPMCAGAIINARIGRVFFGAYDNVMGSFQSVADFSALGYPNSPEIHGGILEKECKEKLTDFFDSIRKGEKL